VPIASVWNAALWRHNPSNPFGHASAVHDAVKAAKASLTIHSYVNDSQKPRVGNDISLIRPAEDVQPGNQSGDHPAVNLH